MKMIHSMIRVADLDRSIQFYEENFDFKVKARFDFEDFTLLYLHDQQTGFEFELTHNHSQKEAYELGNGYGHLAVSTDDLEKAHQNFENKGCNPTPIKEFFYEGSLLGKFFFVQDPDGYKIEVLEASGRFV